MMNNRLSKFMAKVKLFRSMPLHQKLNALGGLKAKFYGAIVYRRIFLEFGQGSSIPNPLRISNAHFIKIGKNLQAWPGLRLDAIETKPGRIPQLIIEDDVSIGHRTTIISHCRVILRKGCGVGPHCFISDAGHPVLDRKSSQPLYQRFATADSFVEIGEGALIGTGTTILPNVRIGARTAIGANSVVRNSIPDDCIASGNPATIQMVYDAENDQWRRPTAKPAS